MPNELNVKLHCKSPKVTINDFIDKYRVEKAQLVDPFTKQISDVLFLNSTKCTDSKKRSKSSKNKTKKSKSKK
jgi:hypothetical protein